MTLASPAPLIDFGNAVLILAVVGLVLLSKALVDLKARVAAIESGKTNPKRPPAAATVPEEAVAAGAVPSISPEIHAVIAAAVFSTVGSNTRIVSVSPTSNLIWSREGRRAVFDSHRVR
ncbi:MAG: hypothetical protein Fur0032_14340 [Terrimicrobiaceae bacterium]